MLTESHGSSRQSHCFPRNLHGGDTVSTRITPDGAIFPDQHGRPRMFSTFQNVRVGIPVPHGSPRTFPDKQGPLRTYTAATRFICRITPDVIRVDPAPIWDWGYRLEWRTRCLGADLLTRRTKADESHFYIYHNRGIIPFYKIREFLFCIQNA